MSTGNSVSEDLDDRTQEVILFLLKDNAFHEQFLLTTIQEYIHRNHTELSRENVQSLCGHPGGTPAGFDGHNIDTRDESIKYLKAESKKLKTFIDFAVGAAVKAVIPLEALRMSGEKFCPEIEAAITEAIESVRDIVGKDQDGQEMKGYCKEGDCDGN